METSSRSQRRRPARPAAARIRPVTGGPAGLARRPEPLPALPGSAAVVSPPPAIRASGLTRDFAGVRAVDRIDLEVPAGAVFGFLGPNGAGKTTTIRLLLGLLEPTSGSAEVLGFDTVRQAHEVRRRTGVLLTQSGLVERLSAEHNLELYGRIARMGRAERRVRIREMLERVGLWERRREKVAGWSRGMKQKLAIARALMHRPALLFLDEPTAGLDPEAAASLRRELAELSVQDGVTVFITTHNLSEVEKLCDLVGVVREGRLLAVGTPEELRARSDRDRLRIAGRGLSDNVLGLLARRPEVADLARSDGGAILDLRSGADPARLVAFLVRLGVEVEAVVPLENSLEEAFLSFMRGEVRVGRSWLVRPGPVARKAGNGRGP